LPRWSAGFCTNSQSHNASFNFTYTPIKGMGVLSATATDASGNTSEFSTDFQNAIS